MKYRENVCQYKNFSSISVVSGSNISHTSSRNRQKNPMGLQESIKMLSLVKASRSPSNPVCCLVFQPPPSRISRMAKHLPPCLRQEFLSSSCSGEKEWKYKLDLICSAWLCVLNVYILYTDGSEGPLQGWPISGGSGGGGWGRGPEVGRAQDGGLVPHHTLLWGSSEPGCLATSRVNGRIHEEGRQTIWKYSTGNLFPCFFGTFQNSLIKKYKGSTPLKNYSFKYLQKQLWYITVYEQILQWKHLWTVPVIFTSTRTHVHLPKFVSSILHLTYLTVN